MPKVIDPLYAEKVKKLTKVETERLLSRMSGKLPRRLEKDKLSKEEALALQLELEDEQLQEWRKMMASLNKKASNKEKQEVKKSEKTKADGKAKPATLVKGAEKTKKVAKAKKSAEKSKTE